MYKFQDISEIKISDNKLNIIAVTKNNEDDIIPIEITAVLSEASLDFSNDNGKKVGKLICELKLDENDNLVTMKLLE